MNEKVESTTRKGEWVCPHWQPDPYYFCTISDNPMPSDDGMCTAASECDEAEFVEDNQ